MTFSHPTFFYLFFLLIPMSAVFVYEYHQVFLRSPIFIHNRVLSNKAFLKTVVSAIFTELACVFLITAAAGPSWGKKYTQEERQYVDVVLAVDVSRSMLMKDVYPTRLDYSASMVRSLLTDDPGIRYSLMILKGGAYELVPMTSDRETVRLAVESLSPDMVTSTGTELGKSLEEVFTAFPDNMQTGKILFLFSDGGDGISDRRILCDRLRERKITVCSVAVGTDTDDPLTDADGNPVLYRGRPVSVPVAPEDLRILAAETGGEFFESGNGLIVSQIRQTLTRYAGEWKTESYTVDNRDDSGWFVFAALVCLCLYYLTRVFLWRKDL